MKNLAKIVLCVLSVASTLGIAGVALASTPVLSASQSGNNVILTITNADPYAVINLYENQSGSWSQPTNIGSTNSAGNYTSNSIPLFFSGTSPIQFYVTVDGYQSSTIQVTSNGSCTSNCNTNNLSLSQTSVSLNSGQNNVVTAYPTSGTIYVSSNSNPSAATYSLNGNQVIVQGIATGSSIITVCASSGSQCSTISVSVNGATTTGITFSNSNPTLVLGQSQSITVYSTSNNSNSYYVSSNTNSNIASASLNGSTLTIYGQNVGTDTISVCQTGTSYCGTLSALVGNTSGSGSLTLSTNTLTLSPGQSGTATVSNAYGTLYISNNSNSSVVSAGITRADGNYLRHCGR